MGDLIIIALGTLTAGICALTIQNVIMMTVGGALIWFGIKKDCCPNLLLPIGFAVILVNIPFNGLMENGGLLSLVYKYGIETEGLPCAVFLSIGAMADFSPLLTNPKLLFLGLAGQCGVFFSPSSVTGVRF